jgi:phosphatidylglycerol:prolipoprotein diacylglycerol transferase
MHFPYYLNLFGWRLHPHTVLEVIAYSAGFQLFLLLRRRWPRPGATVPFEQNGWIIVGGVFGALIGSKLLAWLESPQQYWAASRAGLAALVGGKTIVGGLLGGWIGVELVKKRIGVHRRTGDVYVFPLIVGMCIGRVGCFLTGLADHTYGVETSLPWGVDFGDGVARHPTQLYEIAFLLVLAGALLLRMRRPWVDGDVFRLFILGYLLFRFAVEFIKPRFTGYLGISAIQWTCAAGAAVCVVSLRRIRPARQQTGVTHDRTLAAADLG